MAVLSTVNASDFSTIVNYVWEWRLSNYIIYFADIVQYHYCTQKESYNLKIVISLWWIVFASSALMLRNTYGYDYTLTPYSEWFNYVHTLWYLYMIRQRPVRIFLIKLKFIIKTFYDDDDYRQRGAFVSVIFTHNCIECTRSWNYVEVPTKKSVCLPRSKHSAIIEFFGLFCMCVSFFVYLYRFLLLNAKKLFSSVLNL